MKFLYKMTRVLSDGGLFPDTELSAELIEKSLLCKRSSTSALPRSFLKT
jgi:hypothetical protein